MSFKDLPYFSGPLRCTFLFLLLALVGYSGLKAQKTITLRVYEVSTNIGDCDGFLSGDSDPYWWFTGGDISNECTGTTCNGCTRTVNLQLYNENFICLQDVPSTIGIRFRGCENDGAGCAFGAFTGICDGNAADRTDNIPLPTANGTYTGGPICANSTGCSGTWCYRYEITVSGSFTSPPANDNICSATQIGIGATVNGNNSCATVQSGEVNSSSGSISPSNTTWHYFTAPPSGHVIVTTDLGGTSFDTEIAVYHDNGSTCPGNNWANLTEEGNNDDVLVLINLQSEVELTCLTPGDRYYIQIDGDGAGDFGSYQCRVTSVGQPLQSNDDVCNAIALGNLNFGGSLNNNSFSNICMTTQAGEPNAGCFGEDQTAWFSFTTGATVGTEVTISSTSDPLNNGDDLDLQLALYASSNGACNGSFTEVGCDFDTDLGIWSGEDLTVGCLQPNTTYFLQVDGGALNVEGYFGLSITDNGIAQASNDDICNATNLGILPFGGSLTNNNGNNFCAGLEPGEPNSPGCIYSIDQTVWFTFTTGAQVGYEVTIAAVSDPLNSGDDLDLQAALYESSNNLCTGTLSEIDCDYDPDVPLFWTGEDLVVRCLEPNTTYFVQLDGSVVNVEGFLGLTVTDDGITRGANNLVCDAIHMGTVPAAGNVSLVNQNNFCADTTPGEPKPNSFSIEQTVWFSFQPPPSGSIELEAINSGSDDIDIQVAVWESSNDSCNGFFALLDDYDETFGYSITGTNKLRLKCLDTSKTYFIQLDGLDSILFVNGLTEGIFDLTLYDYNITPAPNDSICDAIPLGDPTGGSVTATNQNNFCSDNILEPVPACFGTNKTVWYQFIAPSTGRVTVSGVSDPNNTGDYLDIQLSVFGSSNDSCTGALMEMGCDYNDLLEFPPLSRDEDLYVECLIPGKPYWVMVDGSDDPDDVDGWFDITITEEPGPPPITNDDICDAIYLGAVPGGGSIQDDSLQNFCATVEPGEPVPSAFGIDRTVWFTFRAPPTGNLTIDATNDPLNFGDNVDLQLSVYESSNDSCNGTFTEVDSDYDPGFFSETLTLTCLEPGKLYFLQVDGALWPLLTLDEGHFGLTLTEDAAFPAYPTNDSICNATNMGVVPAGSSTPTIAGTNFCATVEAGEPGGVSAGSSFFDCLADETVWFKFTASANPGAITVNVTNTQDGIIPSISIFQASNSTTCDFTDLSYIDSTINVLPFLNVSATIPCPDPNATYYVQIDGLDCIGDYGRFDINAVDNGVPSAYPLNDSICNAVPLGLVPSGGATPVVVGDNTCAGEEPGEPNVPGGGSIFTNAFYDETVWYTFTTSGTPGLTTVDVFNTTTLDASIVVYADQNPPSCQFTDLLEVDQASANVVFSGDVSLDIRCLDPNTRYYVQVDGVDVTGDNGPFSIRVQDDGNPYTKAPFDTLCNAANMGAVPAGGSTATISTNNFCSGEEPGEPNVSGGTIVTADSYDETVWFYFNTGATPGLTTVDLFNTVGINAGITVYSTANNSATCNFADLVYITDEDDLFSSDVSVDLPCLPPNTTYYVQVDGVDGIGIDEGTFDIRITDNGNANLYSPNDSLCAAIPLGIVPSGGTTPTLNGNNFCAGEEPLELNVSGLLDITLPAYDETVWFSFTTSNNPGDVDVEVFNTNSIFASANVYAVNPTGSCNFSDLTYIRGANTNIITGDATVELVCLQPNTSYYVQIDGDDVLGQNGTFDIRVTDNGSATPAPANDSICNAVFMGNPNGGQVGAILGTNNCATETPGEPGVNGDDETVWYSFVAPTSGQVEIDIDAINWIDINASLYHSNGGSCLFSDLDQIGNNRDDLLSFSLDFTEDCLIPGDTYFVQIDGNDFIGDMGDFDITIFDDDPTFTPPANDPCSGAIPLTVQNESCQGTGLWQVFNYGTPTVSVNDPFVQGCGDNCGDLWYSFTMPQNGSVLVEGNDEYGFLGLNNSTVTVAAWSGPCNNLSPVNCDAGGFFNDPFYYINGTPGQTYYLQVFDDGGDDINEDFGLCVSDRCGQDSCQYAQQMVAGTVYCWDTDGATGEDIGIDPGYYECGDGSDPGNSVYFTFQNQCAYFDVTITAEIGGLCVLGEPTDGISWALFADATPCDSAPDALVDCQQHDICSGQTWYFNKSYGPFPIGTNFIMQLDGFDFTGDDQGTIRFDETCVLDVELAEFSGWNAGPVNALQWDTYQGWKNDHFIVEKSIDGNVFNPIGRVEGSDWTGGAQGGAPNNSNDLYRYNFDDEAPVSGHNYYRLQMVDRNGSSTYSDVVDIYLNLTESSEIVSIYPNPALNQVNVDVFAGSDGDYYIEIVDLYGHILLDTREDFSQGINTVSFDLDELAQGMYLVRLRNRSNSFRRFGKFIKN